MKITAVCVTYHRPHVLPRLLECFMRQDYPHKELIILDDAGQYPSQPHGEGWQIVSVPRRFRTLGEKHNAVNGLVSADTDAVAVWDDDDVYLPWALSACVSALRQKPWAQPRQILEWTADGNWYRQESFHRSKPNACAYHGSWSFLRSAFLAVRGYRQVNDDDNDLAFQLTAKFGPSAETLSDAFPKPFYAYGRDQADRVSDTAIRYAREGSAVPHDAMYAELGTRAARPVESIVPAWDRDYTAIPIPEAVNPRPW